MMTGQLRTYLILALAVSASGLSSCSTQGASRYGDAAVVPPPIACGTVRVPCAQVIEYHPVQLPAPIYQQPAYQQPAPCPAGQCQAVAKPVVTQDPPVITQQPSIIEPEPYVHAPEPYVTRSEPYTPPAMPERRLYAPKPVVDDPIISCPEGSIPGYGGQDCIPITVPRK